MNNIDFDFSNITKKLGPIAGRSDDESIKKFDKSVFVFPDFSHYMARYFEQVDFVNVAMKRIHAETGGLPYRDDKGNDHLHGTFTQFADGLNDPVNFHGTRYVDSYPLTLSEMNNAKDFISKCPEYHGSIAVLQDCIVIVIPINNRICYTYA